MKCPFCHYQDSRVTDSRETDDGNAIRRRRECQECHRRFTTYELVQESPLHVIKRDGHSEMFDRDKLLRGLMRACDRRGIEIAQLNELIFEVERELRNRLVQEVSSEELGELVLAKLKDLDQVAYIRFASVYRRFSNIRDFMNELERLQPESGKK
ncbi:MAG: transcriptional regulator NrdR [Veillonellaceae bacterium]|nr:transcriptional regulator NrdR [Veillonellaceae bacterium]